MTAASTWAESQPDTDDCAYNRACDSDDGLREVVAKVAPESRAATAGPHWLVTRRDARNWVVTRREARTGRRPQRLRFRCDCGSRDFGAVSFFVRGDSHLGDVYFVGFLPWGDRTFLVHFNVRS